MKKIRVGILFGGKSAEHEVSLQSAKSIIDAIDKEKYETILIGIDKNGRWLLSSNSQYLLHAENPKLISLNASNTDLAVQPGSDKQLISTHLPKPQSVQSSREGMIEIGTGGKKSIAGQQTEEGIGKLDVVFPVLHGPFGEDGSMQGLLKTIDVPFVGAGVLGSAVGMDKDVMKRLLRDAGIPVGKFIVLKKSDVKLHTPLLSPPPKGEETGDYSLSIKGERRGEGNAVEKWNYSSVVLQLGTPFFVKPANLGSSVGVSKVHIEDEFQKALGEAFQYDTKVLVEEYIKGREVECSVLGNESPIASVPGEVLPQHEFYSYEAKYIDEHGAILEIPAKLSPEKTKEVQALAVRTFQTLCCEGMGRVDMFVTEKGRVYVNEINTIPGFTKISMYPKLWEASGISYPELIDRLIQLAIERHGRDSRLKMTFG